MTLESLHTRTIGILQQPHERREPVRARQRLHQLTPAEAVAVAQQYQAGADMRALAIAFKVHRTTVSQCLHELGVPLRRQGLRDEDMAEAAQFYRAGWSLARLGDKYGCAHTAVRTRLLEHGVQLRPRRGWSY